MRKLLVLFIAFIFVLNSFSSEDNFSTTKAENAIFTTITLDAKAAAMGNIKMTNLPTSHLGSKSKFLKISTKEQLGIIPYKMTTAFLGVREDFGINFNSITSEDNLKTRKTEFGFGIKFKKVKIGFNMNNMAAEVVEESVPSQEMQNYIYKINSEADLIIARSDNIISNMSGVIYTSDQIDDAIQDKTEAELSKIYTQDLKGTKAKGTGNDLMLSLALTKSLEVSYMKKNIKAIIEWDVLGEKLEETLSEEEIFGFYFNGEKIKIVGELEDFDRINIGFERNYYDKLDLRAGISRGIKSSDNIIEEKDYTIGLGFKPINRKILVGVDMGYQLKYFGRNDIFGGNSEDDLVLSTYIRF